MNFTEIMNTCYTIKNISSTNEKKAFLQSITDEDFKNFLKWLFDSSIVSGLSDKKLNKDISFYGENILNKAESIFDVFKYLETHKTGTDSDIRRIQWYRNQICKDDEEKEFFNRVVSKNLPLGCDVKVINSVWNGLIPTFDVGLCDVYYKNPKLVDGTKDFILDTKTDGCRCVAIKENGNVRLVSRQGKSWIGMVEIENALRESPYDNIVFDSEITIKNPQNYPSKDVYKMTTKIVSTKDEEKVGLQLNCFDYMTLEEWNNKKSKFPCIERKSQLEKIIKNINSPYLVYVENLYVGHDVNKIEEFMSGIVREKDMEGLVLKFCDSSYEWKRSKNWLKIKQMDELDAYIVGYTEGKNQLSNMLGTFVCEINHPTFGKLHFECGSGYSLDERKRFWGEKDNLIGRVISVQYFEQTINEDTQIKSLRFPVFLELKEEGQEPNN